MKLGEALTKPSLRDGSPQFILVDMKPHFCGLLLQGLNFIQR
jgi:hypothetical protein